MHKGISFEDGRRAGHLDKLLGIRSEYSWHNESWPSVMDQYRRGYRAGWNETKAWN